MAQHFSGKKLRELRRAAIPKLSQQELADRLGIRRETVNKIENNHEATIKAIKMEIVLQWYEICGTRTSTTAKQNFVHYVSSLWRA